MRRGQDATLIDSEGDSLDQRPLPAKWRNLLPYWLISLIWADSVAKYDAFLSYSWRSDTRVAPVIQSVLQQFLRPWFKPRAKAIFRDLSSLPAGSSLEKELYDRLDRSDHLIVLASPKAAQSEGMEIEAKHWRGGPHHCHRWRGKNVGRPALQPATSISSYPPSGQATLDFPATSSLGNSGNA
jgi:TIR domain